MRGPNDMEVLYPLRFKEILRNYGFGNRWIVEAFAKEGLPDDHRVAETWEVCDRPGESSIVARGELEGATLHELIERYRKAGMMDSGLLQALGSMPRLEKTVLEAATADPAGFEEACKAWLEKRLQMPPSEGGIRQDDAQFKNIGRLSRAPHPPLTGKYKQRYELKYGKPESQAP